jgi:hypothetical protein
MNPDAPFHRGREMCSDSVAFDVLRMREIWSLARATPMKSMEEPYTISVIVTYPSEVAISADGGNVILMEKWLQLGDPFTDKIP